MIRTPSSWISVCRTSRAVEVLRQLRERWNPVPVLILSVFGQEGSKIAGLDAGADDYLTKPFGDGENSSRAAARASLRRVKIRRWRRANFILGASRWMWRGAG